MISTRRQVETQNDRYGGYTRQNASRVIVDEPLNEEKESLIGFSRPKKQVNTIAVPGHDYSLVRDEEAVHYSNRPTISADIKDMPVSTDYIGLVEKHRKASKFASPVKERTERRNREDVMPSIRTQAYVLKEEEEKERKSEFSARSKIILSVYVAVVVVLAAIVIATGIAISGVTGEVVSLENELSVRNEIFMRQQDTINYFNDPNVNAGRGAQNDMTQIKGVYEVKLVAEIIPQSYEKRTNWFDKFCDFLSKLIGNG